MPITKGAIRKLRADKRKAAVNLSLKTRMKAAVGKMRKKPTAAALAEAYKILDRAAKKRVITKNKAGRLKSRLAVNLQKGKR